MTKTEFYNKAAALIEKGWNQNVYSKDEKGNNCNPEAKAAVSWCLSGALLRVFYLSDINYGLPEARAYLGLGVAVATWNDHPDRTQKDVVRLLKNAARRADEEGKTSG